MAPKIYYRERIRYKYFLAKDYALKVTKPELIPSKDIDAGYCTLLTSGDLMVHKGYGWDGPSGPTIDTKSFMRGSLIHDVYYQLMREGYIPQTSRKAADELLREICREDGMSRVRAWYVYRSVRLFAAGSAKSNVIEAP
jgi:hypothetical protein